MFLDTRQWAARRRMMYLSGAGAIVFFILASIYALYFYTPPNCFDGWKNGGEVGVDCGGSCARACLIDVVPPVVRWAEAFRISPDMYNAVAYVENRNSDIGVKNLSYRFSFYDERGSLITTIDGHTTLPPNDVYALFEDRIDLRGAVPKRVELTMDPNPVWEKMSNVRKQFSITGTLLKSADFEPRLNASITNQTLDSVENVEAIATIFDAKNHPLTASRTFVPRIDGKGTERLSFTWPEPIAKTLRSCEVPTDVMLAIDLSGSINDDGGTPPEPLATVLKAAQSFAGRLRSQDQVGVATFATESKVVQGLTTDTKKVSDLIGTLRVEPKEERGSTNTGDGIKDGVIELFSERHNPDARKVLVVLTDGIANAPEEDTAEEYALALANESKKYGITIFSIGLGKNVNAEFVRSLASDPGYGYLAVDRSTLDGIYRAISTAICEDGAAVIDIIPKIDVSR